MKLKPILISWEHYTDDPVKIVLVDAEARIEEDDLYYNSVTSKIHMASDTHETWENESKIIASTNSLTSSHNLPLLSAKATSILINYYNEHKCMPESVKVGTYTNHASFCGFDLSTKEIKLNQQGEVDITIPEVERRSIKDCVASHEGDTQYEEKLYTRQEMINFACDVFNKQLSTHTCKSFKELATEMV